VYTGGNCVLLSPAVLLKQRAMFEQAVALRKDPVGMARLLGFGFIVKFLTRRLSAADIERVVRQKLGIHGAIIEVPYAEIGFDVDKPEDLELARRVLARRQAKSGDERRAARRARRPGEEEQDGAAEHADERGH